LTILERRKQEPINISKADVHRAVKKAEEFMKLLERGRTQEEIFEEMVKLIFGDE